MIDNAFTEDQLMLLYNWLIEKEEAGYTLGDVIDEQWDRSANNLSVPN